MIRNTADGVELDVRVIPRARHNMVAGIRDGKCLVRLTAPPLDGAANEALIRTLADALGLPARAIQLLSGARSRTKRVRITGLTAPEVERRLLG